MDVFDLMTAAHRLAVALPSAPQSNLTLFMMPFALKAIHSTAQRALIGVYRMHRQTMHHNNR